MIKTSIIIPVFNNHKYTEACLGYLSHLDSSFEIIVVNNGSKDRTEKMLQEQQEIFQGDKPELVVINSKKNLGFGRGNNQGYRKARGQFIIFLNNDIKVQDLQGWAWPLLTEAEETGGIVCLKGAELDKSFNFVKEGHNLIRSKYWYMSGWCLAAQKETFDKLIQDHHYDLQSDQIVEGPAPGPWNEKFFLYYEDGDMTWRAQDLDIPIVELNSSSISHIGRVTGAKYKAFVFLKKSRRIFSKIWKGR